MKHVTIRPGKTVPVSDEVLARARNALKTFGIESAALASLAAFKGDVTIGPMAGRVRPTAGRRGATVLTAKAVKNATQAPKKAA